MKDVLHGSSMHGFKNIQRMTLRELISHRQTTGAALGRALGWSRATVSDYVTGRRRPKLETAARIATALDAVVIVPVEKGASFGYAPEPVTKK